MICPSDVTSYGVLLEPHKISCYSTKKGETVYPFLYSKSSLNIYFKLFNILSTDNVLSISDRFAQPLLAWPIPNIKKAKCT